MRTSHYNYLLEEFDYPLGEMTKSGRGARKKARVFELRPWDKSNIINLVDSSIQGEEDWEHLKVVKTVKSLVEH
jgi:hypothetical protein